MAPECPSSPVGTSIDNESSNLSLIFFFLSFTNTAVVWFGFDNKGFTFLP